MHSLISEHEIYDWLQLRLKTETQINAETSLTDDLALDSLEAVEILVDLEEHFKVEIDLDDLLQIDTVGEALELIKEK